MADGPVRKQAVATIDDRTTSICMKVAGQIRRVDEPYSTLNGDFDLPPFHLNCRTMSVPYMDGFVYDHRRDANAELQSRPKKDRDWRNARRIPWDEANPPVVPKAPRPNPTALANRTRQAADAARKPLDVTPTLNRWTRSARYTKGDRAVLDRYLREGVAFDKQIRKGAYPSWFRALRSAVEQVRAPRAFVAYRAVGSGRVVLGSKNLTGGTITDAAFLAAALGDGAGTTIARSVGGAAAVVEIIVPKGTRVGVASAEVGIIVLGPGTTLRVVSDEQRKIDGKVVRWLTAIVE